MAYSCRSRLRIRSSSLRVMMEWRCGFNEIIVEDAPCLERLLFHSISDRRPVRIVNAPRVEVLGFLDLQAGMNVRARAMLPSLKMLAVKVRFSHDMEVKMLDTLLRCFPRLETLHVMSIQPSSPDSVDCAEFWKSLGSCDCLESHLKTFVFHRYQGLDCEYLFLCYILKKGKVLKTLGLDCADSDDVVVEGGPMSGSSVEGNAPTGGSSGSDDVVMEGGPMSGSAGEGNVSSGGSGGSNDVVKEGGPVSGSVGEGNAPSGGSRGSNIIYVCVASPCWTFQNAIDLSVEDPFCVLRHDKCWIALELWHDFAVNWEAIYGGTLEAFSCRVQNLQLLLVIAKIMLAFTVLWSMEYVLELTATTDAATAHLHVFT
ncbi:hypothetical protein TRIUR3_33589 [Triticum urartu]|uniref:Uncharacterized protein n=1 Tax=Triticum urartu TaxID=4572 RepID=M7ZX74_TRIUA|nr:hypothetical protein TRIUR3_33589 [Triticum urartu]